MSPLLCRLLGHRLPREPDRVRVERRLLVRGPVVRTETRTVPVRKCRRCSYREDA